MRTQQLQEQWEEAVARTAALRQRIQATARAEQRELGPGELQAINQAVQEANALRARLDRLHDDAAITDAINQLTGGLGTVGGDPSPIASSLGAQILESETGRWLRANRGKFPTGGVVWTSPSSEIMAATITSNPASGGGLVHPDVRPGIHALPTAPLTIAELLAPGMTDSNAVAYMRESLIVNAAAPVAEAQPKPESTIAFEAVTDPVRKIATWIPVSEEMLEDVPALRAHLDARLRLFVQLAEDDQLLNGNGTAPNIRGILARTGLAAPIARTTETNPDVILKQMSAIETANQLPVDGIVLHPLQWQAMLLLKDADGNYIAGGGPFGTPLRKTLWGRDVAVTPAIAAGTALVGSFKAGAIFFRRGGLRVEASNSHANFFVENLVAIRAESRGALAVVRPAAFGVVTNLN